MINEEKLKKLLKRCIIKLDESKNQKVIDEVEECFE